MNRPGLDMFSAEWMRENATEVPPAFHPMIASICGGYQLGDATDPNIIWKMIINGIKKILSSKATILPDPKDEWEDVTQGDIRSLIFNKDKIFVEVEGQILILDKEVHVNVNGGAK